MSKQKLNILYFVLKRGGNNRTCTYFKVYAKYSMDRLISMVKSLIIITLFVNNIFGTLYYIDDATSISNQCELFYNCYSIIYAFDLRHSK